MAFPKVFEVAFKVEIETHTREQAIAAARESIAERGVQTYVAVIRDDDKFGGQKDEISRHTEHIAILGSEKRQQLEALIMQLHDPKNTNQAERTEFLNKALHLLSWDSI
jgi:hypothetical protein